LSPIINYDTVLYNISFNLTLINQTTKKTTGSPLVDSILSKNESSVKPLEMTSETINKPLDVTNENIQKNDNTGSNIASDKKVERKNIINILYNIFYNI
jgi:hypothetical protein